MSIYRAKIKAPGVADQGGLEFKYQYH